MAVERKDLFNDGSCYCDYYAGNRVELRVAGFKVVIYKPYVFKYYNSDRVYSKAIITMSTNSTVFMLPSDFDLLKKAVVTGINILNMEGFNLITQENVAYFDTKYLVEAKDNPFKDVKLPKNRTANLKYGDNDCGILITSQSGEKSLYIGKGRLKAGSYIRNRVGCEYIYMTVPRLFNWKTQIVVQDDTMEVDLGVTWFDIDTYRGKKKAFKLERCVPEGTVIHKLVIKEMHNTPKLFEIS